MTLLNLIPRLRAAKRVYHIFGAILPGVLSSNAINTWISLPPSNSTPFPFPSPLFRDSIPGPWIQVVANNTASSVHHYIGPFRVYENLIRIDSLIPVVLFLVRTALLLASVFTNFIMTSSTLLQHELPSSLSKPFLGFCKSPLLFQLIVIKAFLGEAPSIKMHSYQSSLRRYR